MAAQSKEIFKFNLIPPRPVLDVEIEAERDRSVVYAVLLVFFASLVYFLLGLIQLTIVDPRVKTMDQTILNRDQTIESYSAIQGLHGELVIKTETLEPVLAKKVNPDEIFRIADSIVSSTEGTQVEGYSREPSGLFVFQLKSRDYVELSDLIANIEDIQGVRNVFMRSAVLNTTDFTITSTVALIITNIMPGQDKTKTKKLDPKSAKEKTGATPETTEGALPTANNPALSNAPWNKEKPKANPGRILRIYVVPIVTLLIFFGMIIFLILPAITVIFEKLDSLTTKTEQVALRDDTITSLKTLSSNINLVQEDLDDLNSLVPTGTTQVVNFQTKITDLAKSKLLKVNGVTIGEQILKVEGDIPVSLGVIEIPSLFSLQGSLGNIKDFITSLQTINDFVIVGEMKLNAVSAENADNSDNWTLDLTLIKYQFQTPDEINQLTAKYATVPPVTQPDEVVLNYIRLLSAAQ